jgi:hypothetical protein
MAVSFDAVVFGCFLPAPQNQLKTWHEHERRWTILLESHFGRQLGATVAR